MGTSLLRKAGESQYEVVVDEDIIGRVWEQVYELTGW